MGFSKGQIGILLAIPGISCVIAGPLWGALADKLQRHRSVHYWCISVSMLLFFSMQFVESFWCMATLVALSSFHLNPIAPLLDQCVMCILKKTGGEYGKQRLFGSLGAGIGALGTSEIIKHTSIKWIFNLQLISSILLLVLVQFLPEPGSNNNNTRERETEQDNSAATTAVPKDHSRSSDSPPPPLSYYQSLKLLFHQHDLLLLFLLVLILGTMHGLITSFLGLYVFNLSKGNTNIVGVVAVVQNIAELPAFFFAGSIVDKLGTSHVLSLSAIGFLIRLIVYAYSNTWSANTSWALIPFELLHGVTYSLAWTACTTYAFNRSPARTEGTVLGALAAMLNGFGRGAGTLLGGWLYGHYGSTTMWLTGAGFAPVLLILTLFFGLLSKKKKKKEEKKDEGSRRLSLQGGVSLSDKPTATSSSVNRSSSWLDQRGRYSLCAVSLSESLVLSNRPSYYQRSSSMESSGQGSQSFCDTKTSIFHPYSLSLGNNDDEETRALYSYTTTPCR